MNHSIGLYSKPSNNLELLDNPEPLNDSEELISWASSSYKSDNYSYTENIAMLTSSYSPGSSITNSSNILEIDSNGVDIRSASCRIKHRHYKLFQKRFNKCMLNIEHMELMDKIRLRYIS